MTTPTHHSQSAAPKCVAARLLDRKPLASLPDALRRDRIQPHPCLDSQTA